jgi:SAM-dependent methyltransferase
LVHLTPEKLDFSPTYSSLENYFDRYLTPEGKKMSFPIIFQPIERELDHLKSIVTGAVLNAGCGNRDITNFLTSCGAKTVTNVDIQSSIKNAVIADLKSLPFTNEVFDLIICNAVLEHHPDPTSAVAEITRVAKYGAHIVLCVPFLQPYHPCPGDYTRYTLTGLKALGEGAGLEVVQVREIHTVVHTISWILWEYLTDRRSRFLRTLLYWPLYLSTRIASLFPPRVVTKSCVGNTFQIVFLKAG